MNKHCFMFQNLILKTINVERKKLLLLLLSN